MVANKHITKIILAVMAAAVVLCFLAIAFSGKLTELLGGTGVRMEYEYKLFDTDEIIRVDIQMDEDTWNEMLENAMAEEYYVCDVVINGQRVSNVAIRPKGNTSLSAIAMDADTDRYSLKLEFDHFVEGQTCYGLDKLILNNNYADATNMKEAVVYDMYQYLGADASLYNYAEVSVNGEYWGVYLALEGVEQSFMLRNYGTQDGELYKPDSMEMGGGNESSSNSSVPSMDGMDFSDLDLSSFAGMTPPSGAGSFPFGGNGSDGKTSDDSEDGGRPSFGGFSDFDPGSLPDSGDFRFDGEAATGKGSSKPSGMGDFSMGGGGANLNYTDDELDSYSTIWEGEVTNTGKADHRKVVTALKNISEGTDLETYLDVDNVLKYMAVHTFAVNMDSLSGSMAHNYYLYEYGGQLNIIPWDYNLSLGGMSMGNDADATEVVNDAIDTPFSGTKFFDALLENEEYLARYHAYLQQLVDEYVNGGRFDEVYDRIRNQIDSLVETDPTAFYPYDEYQTAAELLYETVKLRAESIDGQLDGTIPSTDEGQRQDSASLIDASHIDLAAMGKFSMGGSSDFKGRSDRMGSRPERDGVKPSDVQTDSQENPENAEASPQPDDFDPNDLPEGFNPNNMPGGGSGFGGGNAPDMGSFSPGNLPDMGEFDPNNMPDMGGFSPGGMPNMGGFTQPDATDDAAKDDGANAPAQDGGASAERPSSGEKSRPSGFSGMTGQASSTMKNLLVFGACFALMAVALVVVFCVKRRRKQ